MKCTRWLFEFTCSWFIFVFILLCNFCCNASSNSVIPESRTADSNQEYGEFKQLPDCDRVRELNQNRLIFVSTLDGKLSALDADSGVLKWMVDTGPGNLLSSSIHKLELTNNGQWVRMIPSLSGGLYQFDGDSIEPIPITADNLLSSSFKFSDDLVISGGKEIRSYSVSLKTGQLQYECSMHGCTNHTADQQNNPFIDDAIIIRRQTQTVRAIEPRSGSERWNFSVGHNDLELIRSEICHSTYLLDNDNNFNIKISVPEGIIYSVSNTNPQQILWQYKFEYPIVNAWNTDKEKQLVNVDIFSSSDDHWLKSLNANINISPSVYIGMFQKQLYVQESELLKKSIHKNLLHSTAGSVKYPQIPWKPHPAASQSLLLIENDSVATENILNPSSDGEDTPVVTALSVLYASEYVNGNGFFLYTPEDLNQSQTELCDKDVLQEEEKEPFDSPFDNDIPVKYIVVSLWFWWKEICVIAISSALLLNLFISRKISNGKEIIVVERHIEVPKIIEKEPDYVYLESICKPHIVQHSFQSRFITDFDLVRCLGKGGFGVVFEVKNKLDDCHYAIKRIVLPNKKESRDRVMREVKTLANCEHENIVRYFQAWVETPPNGWQANQDKLLFDVDKLLSTSIDIESTVTETKSHISKQYTFPNFTAEHGDESFTTQFSDRGIDYPDDSLSFIEFRHDTNSLDVHSKIECSDSCAIEFREHSHSSTKDSNHIILLHSKSDSAIEYDKKSKKKSKSYKELSVDQSSTQCSEAMPSRKDESTTPSKIYLYIQMQLCRKQSLRDWLRANDQKSRHGQIINIFGQIVQAVEYVHLKGLIHRDLKPSNIFFSLDGQIKIGDFGLVTDMSDIPNMLMNCGDNTGLPSCARHTEQVGTYLYMSPEQLQGKPYSYKVDIYSLGLIFFELIVAFNTEMERLDTLKKLRNSNFPEDFQHKYTEEYKLLQLMLSQHPNERPTTFGIRAYPPFNHRTDDKLHFHLDLNTLSRSRNNSVSIMNGSL